MTSSLLARSVLKPRELIAQPEEPRCATCRLSARRKASGRVVAPERRISSCVITWMADAAPSSFSGCLATDVTSMFSRSSTLSCLSWLIVEESPAAKSGTAQRPPSSDVTTMTATFRVTRVVMTGSFPVTLTRFHPMHCVFTIARDHIADAVISSRARRLSDVTVARRNPGL